MSLENYKSKIPINGSTTINHEIRVKLGLNCSEYCLLDYVTSKRKCNVSIDSNSINTNLGFNASEQQALFNGLLKKGFVEVSPTGDYLETNKFLDAFPDMEKEFDDNFWYESVNGKRVVAWTGTKKKALEYYEKLRMKYSLDYFIKQRSDYFEMLQLEYKRGFARQRMMAQVFLNPMNERFAEDYAESARRIKVQLNLIKEENEKQEALTLDKVKEMYGKNN